MTQVSSSQSNPPSAEPRPETRSTDPSGRQTDNTTESRTQLVTLYVRGNDADAKALYGASPGATDAGWQSLERMLAPVKAFVQNGDPPYVNPMNFTTEYAGLVVPEPEVQGAQQAGRQNVAAQEELKAKREQRSEPGTPVTGTANDAGSSDARSSSKGSLSADVEAEKHDRGEGSKDANPGGRPHTDEDPPAQVPAYELKERAQNAKNKAELDEIESLANGRVTVEDAVAQRREELGIK